MLGNSQHVLVLLNTFMQIFIHLKNIIFSYYNDLLEYYCLSNLNYFTYLNI